MADAPVNRTVFRGDLSAPDPIPDDGIEAALRLLRDGRLFRYGEDRGGLPETARLEEEFAAHLGLRYALGVNSGGCALFLGLKCAGVEPGDKVLVNAFTLAPVPGAIAHAHAEAVLIDITERYVIDIEDLDRKAAESGARYLLLSYMRGHIPDMDALMAVRDKHGLTVIEDCAHTMGAGWDGRPTGTFGAVGCFSAQTFKHVNSGEGGLLATDDEDIAAKAILHSGSYMLYAQHGARPDLEVFERHRYTTPNFSMRMSSLVASLIRPQLKMLDRRTADWRAAHRRLAERFDAIDHLRVPPRPAKEDFVPSSIQFSLEGLTAERIDRFLTAADRHGVHVKWFGRGEPVGFTSTYEHWRYLGGTACLPRSKQVLDGLCDIRIPMSMSAEDCDTVAAVLSEAMAEATAG